MRPAIVLLIALTGCGGGGGASGEPAPALTGRYVMAFHAYDGTTGEGADPRNHVTYIAQSDDGASWTPVSGYVADFGSVPDLVRRGDTLYLYRGRHVVRYRINENRWGAPEPVAITDADGNGQATTDNSFIVDEAGRIATFYVRGMVTEIAKQPGGTMPFGSATEVEGSDGAMFVTDEGMRLEIPRSGTELYTDPDIFRGPNGYVLYVSYGPSVLAFTCSALRGTYAAVAALPNAYLARNLGGVPSGHYDATNGTYWTYVHTTLANGMTVIRRAVHATLDTPLAESDFATVLSGAGFPGLGAAISVESPGVAPNEP
ncbi:MAG: hypothetical protein HYY17_02150 [Planctomycetes bacterium]|nr:hypothetical protein [Planctomycetota bacterium]